MSRLKLALLPGIVLAGAVPALAQEPDTVFINAEYWECPKANLSALTQAADSIWAPIFDEMVDEGRFISWTTLRPVRALDFEFVEGSQGGEEVTPAWDWVVSWTAASKEAFDTAWSEFIDRLRARFPDDPRPTRFCGDLQIVQYRAPVRR